MQCSSVISEHWLLTRLELRFLLNSDALDFLSNLRVAARKSRRLNAYKNGQITAYEWLIKIREYLSFIPGWIPKAHTMLRTFEGCKWEKKVLNYCWVCHGFWKRVLLRPSQQNFKFFWPKRSFLCDILYNFILKAY